MPAAWLRVRDCLRRKTTFRRDASSQEQRCDGLGPSRLAEADPWAAAATIACDPSPHCTACGSADPGGSQAEAVPRRGVWTEEGWPVDHEALSEPQHRGWTVSRGWGPCKCCPIDTVAHEAEITVPARWYTRPQGSAWQPAGSQRSRRRVQLIRPGAHT